MLHIKVHRPPSHSLTTKDILVQIILEEIKLVIKEFKLAGNDGQHFEFEIDILLFGHFLSFLIHLWTSQTNNH